MKKVTSYLQDKRIPAHLVDDGFEKRHGRLVRRRYFAVDIKSLPLSVTWPGVKIALAVETIRSTKRTPVTAQWRYYLSSHAFTHPSLTQYVRHHWGIENKLHWMLDVQMKEDDDFKTERRSAKAFATLMRIALNIVKIKDQPPKRSTRRKMLWTSWCELKLLL